MKTTTKILIGGAAIGVIGLYAKYKAGQALTSIGESINPVSDENAFYTGVNSVGEVLADDKHFTLGSWIYDQVHGQEVAHDGFNR